MDHQWKEGMTQEEAEVRHLVSSEELQSISRSFPVKKEVLGHNS